MRKLITPFPYQEGLFIFIKQHIMQGKEGKLSLFRFAVSGLCLFIFSSSSPFLNDGELPLNLNGAQCCEEKTERTNGNAENIWKEDCLSLFRHCFSLPLTQRSIFYETLSEMLGNLSRTDCCGAIEEIQLSLKQTILLKLNKLLLSAFGKYYSHSLTSQPTFSILKCFEQAADTPDTSASSSPRSSMIDSPLFSPALQPSLSLDSPSFLPSLHIHLREPIAELLSCALNSVETLLQVGVVVNEIVIC